MNNIEIYIKEQIFIVITEDDYNKNLQDMGLDSMQFISLIVSLEEKYNFEFEDNMLVFSEMSSVKMISNNIKKIKNNTK